MPSKEQWIKTTHDHLKLPKFRVAFGKPKKLRKRALDESRDPKNPNRMRKYGARMRCEKCTGLGHNKGSCPLNRSSASQLNIPHAASVSFFVPYSIVLNIRNSLNWLVLDFLRIC